MARNLTLALDEDTIRKVRVVAARRGLSVSALIREELARLAGEHDAYQAARDSARIRLTGTHRLGGGPLPSREDLHDRADLR